MERIMVMEFIQNVRKRISALGIRINVVDTASPIEDVKNLGFFKKYTD